MLTREQAVNALREAADSWRAEADRPNVSTALEKAYIEDAIDLRLVSDFLEEGADKTAWHHATRLDTIVRECIPNDVWEFLEHHVLLESDWMG